MSSDSAPIRVLAVDDHQLIRVGIATLLLPESDMKLVGEACNGREAIVKFRECRPDVTLMDLQMPEMSGFDAIIAIRDEFPGARIIVLTTYAGDAQAYLGSRWRSMASRLHILARTATLSMLFASFLLAGCQSSSKISDPTL